MKTPMSGPATITISPHFQPDVFVPKAFPKEGDAPMWNFKAYELKYLDALHRGITPEKALQIAGIPEERGHRILTRKKAKEYLSDLLRQRMAAEAWTQERWLSELSKVWYGEKVAVTREQMEAIKEIGARVCPKPEKVGSGGSGQPVITINFGAAEAALKRQEIIEAQIVNGSAGNTGTIPASV